MPFIIYAALAIAFTWPLAIHPTSLLAAPVGPGDPYLNLWALGWGMQAWTSNPVSIVTGRVFDGNIFHPALGTLAYSDHLLLQSAALAPLYALTDNVVLCYNALLLASLVASALAMHLFVSRVVGSKGGAYVAGMAWGFGSYPFAQLIHLQLQALYLLPLAFLFLHRVIAKRRKRDAVVLGLLAGLQAIASVYYAVIGGLALVIAGVVLAMAASRRGATKVIGRFALAVVIAAIVVGPVGIVYWRVQQAEGFGRNLYEAGRNAAFADSYLQAPPGNVLYGRTGLLRQAEGLDAAGLPHTGPERELFPGFVLALLALAGVLMGWRSDSRPLVAAMIATALAGFVLSLGPDGVRVIYATLHRYLFGFQAIRASARFGLLVSFALATLAGLGWRELSGRAHRIGRLPAAISALALAAVLLECLHLPVTLAAAPPIQTNIGQWLRTAPGTGAVAVLPLGLDIDSTPAMVQSLEHRRPILNGYSGQRPAFYTALVDAVSTFPSDTALLALHASGVQYIVSPTPVARPDGEGEWPLTPRAQFAEGTIYELTWTPGIEERLTRLETVTPPPPGPIPFHAGEEAHYIVSWDGAGVTLPAGEIVLSVERQAANAPAPGYQLVAAATTAPWVARFFEADDRFTTTTDGDLLPLRHERQQNEGSRHVTRAYLYDWGARVVRTGRTIADAERADAVTLPLMPQSRDMLAGLFFARTLPLNEGALVRFPVNEAGTGLILELRPGAREQITVGGQPIDAVRLEPRVQQRVERRAQATATVWLSTDARRVPLVVDVAAGFGRLHMELSSYKAGS